jgi:hypothetical protein
MMGRLMLSGMVMPGFADDSALRDLLGTPIHALERFFVHALIGRQRAALRADHLHDDVPLEFADANRQPIAVSDLVGGFGALAVELDLTPVDRLRGQRPRLEESRRPQPLVEPRARLLLRPFEFVLVVFSHALPSRGVQTCSWARCAELLSSCCWSAHI